MYVPPFDSLLKAIGMTRAEFEEFDGSRDPEGAAEAAVTSNSRQQRL